jgi:DNA helicase-2/ATP-dependent DNA helicase PcrA
VPAIPVGMFELFTIVVSFPLQSVPVAVIIETLIKRIKYEDFLKKEDDFAQRWENVKELINFSTIVAQAGTAVAFEPRGSEGDDDVDEEVDNDGMDHDEECSDSWKSAPSIISADDTSKESINTALSSTAKTEGGESRGSKRSRIESDVIDLLSSDEEDVKPKKQSKTKKSNKKEEPTIQKSKAKAKEDVPESEDTNASSIATDDNTSNDEKSPLRIFLEASTLSTDMEQDDQDGKSPKVTIATTHAAKG